METITCPKCGTINEAGKTNCVNCHINLQWAREHWEEEASEHLIREQAVKLAREQAKDDASKIPVEKKRDRKAVGAGAMLGGITGVAVGVICAFVVTIFQPILSDFTVSVLIFLLLTGWLIGIVLGGAIGFLIKPDFLYNISAPIESIQNRKDVHICSSCGSINMISRQKCYKCGNVLEALEHD